MKIKLLLSLFLLSIAKLGISQATNIYQPNGATTKFGKVTSDSLNYYVVNYPALTLMKIAPNNEASLVTTLPADPFQTMIMNNGKGIFPISAGSPFKLFNGTSLTDVEAGKLPLAGYTPDKVIALDYFHKGAYTYFRTSDKIYKTDYSTPSSITTLATRQSATGVGITHMSYTTSSIIYQNIVLTATGVLRRIDLATGNITTIDSSTIGISNYAKGIVYNDDYYYCTPFESASLGSSKIFKISNSGVKTIIYTETNSSKYIFKVIGATPNGIIAVTRDNSGGNEYISINNGVATSLNFGTFANSYPANNFAGGVTTSSLVYFNAYDTTRSMAINNALWVTDGTLGGTKKIKGGPSSTFAMSGLGQEYLGTFGMCGNDIYYEGRNGPSYDCIIYVNGTTFSMQAYTSQPTNNPVTMRQTANGIYLIAGTSPSTSTKAVYKLNCSTIDGNEDQISNQVTIDLFPNPSNGLITIKLQDNAGICDMKIYNMLGEIMHCGIIQDELTSLNLNLKSGVYFISIDNKGQKYIRKFLVE